MEYYVVEGFDVFELCLNEEMDLDECMKVVFKYGLDALYAKL